jgi:cobalamin biosynthesis protein CobT
MGFVHVESSIHVVIVQNETFVETRGVHLDNVSLEHAQSKFVIHCTLEDSGEKMKLSSDNWIHNPEAKSHRYLDDFVSAYERSAKLLQMDKILLSIMKAFGPKKKMLDEVSVSALIKSYQIDDGGLFSSSSDGDENTLKELSQEGSEEEKEEEEDKQDDVDMEDKEDEEEEEGEKEDEEEEEEGIPVDNDDDGNLSDDSDDFDATQMLTQSQATSAKQPRTVPKRAASSLDTSLSQSQQAPLSAKRQRRPTRDLTLHQATPPKNTKAG